MKNWVYWKTLRIKAIKVVWGIKVAEKEVFLCLYAVSIVYNHPVWFMKFYLFTLQVLKILRTEGQIEGFCLYILDKISFNLKRFSERFFFPPLSIFSHYSYTNEMEVICPKVWWLRNIYSRLCPSKVFKLNNIILYLLISLKFLSQTSLIILEAHLWFSFYLLFISHTLPLKVSRLLMSLRFLSSALCSF